VGNKVSMAANIRLILASDKDAQLRCYTMGSTSTVARLFKITIAIAMSKCQAYQTEFLFAVDYASATARPRRRGIRVCPRIFDQVGHETLYASSENKNFFTKSYHRQTYQNYEQPPRISQNSYFQSHFSVLKIG
jgi:hypothetical protein